MQNIHEKADVSLKNLFVPLTTTKAITFIAIIGFLIYTNSLFGAFLSDDNAQIVENVLAHSLSNLSYFFMGGTFHSGGNLLIGLFYRPLLVTYFSLLWSIFGPHPFFFHLFQVTFHIVNALLLFRIFRHWFVLEVAFFLSLLFVVHPMNVEAVAWISASGTVLSGLFGLTALCLLMKKGDTGRDTLAALICLLIAGLFQESGMLFILLIFAYKLLFNKDGLVLYSIGSAVVIAIYAVLRFGLAHLYFNNQPSAPIMTMTLSNRILNIPEIIIFYFRTFIYPIYLSFHQIWTVTKSDWNSVYIPAIIVVLLVMCSGLIGYQLYHRRGDQLKVFGFFLLWLVIGMVLYIQIIPAEMTVAERWFYLPMIGLLGTLGVIAQGIGKVRSRPIVAVFLIIATALAIRTVIRNFDWHSGFALYSHDIRNDPDNYVLTNSLGTEYLVQGNYKKAIEYLERSTSKFANGMNLGNLANAYFKNGDLEHAKEAYQESIQVNEMIYSVNNYALLLINNDEHKEAEQFIQAKLIRYPNEWTLWVYLAIAKYNLNQLDEATQAAKKAYELSVNKQSAYIYRQILLNNPIKIKIE